VQEGERQILAPLRHERFSSFSTLNEAMGRHLQQLNDRVMQGYGFSCRQLFERPDPACPQAITYPPFCAGPMEASESEQCIEIFYDHKHIAAHPQGQASYHYTTLAEYMPPQHWAYKQPSRERFLAWAKRIGSQTQAQVEAIFGQKAHEEQAFRTLKGIQRLATEYGCQRLEAACKRANLFNSPQNDTGIVGRFREQTRQEDAGLGGIRILQV